MVGPQLVFRHETWVCNDYNATSILKIARNWQRQTIAKSAEWDFPRVSAVAVECRVCIGPTLCLGNGGQSMADKRHKPEEIVQKLRPVDVLVGQGMQRVDAIREVRITEQTYYRWRKQYGGMGTDQLKELKRLQKENERLRKAVSDLTLDKLILKEAARGNF